MIKESNAPYRLAILIPPGNSLNFLTFVAQLRVGLASSGLAIETEGTSLAHLADGRWSYHLSWEEDPYVQTESAEIAELFGKTNPQKQVI